MIVTGRRPAPRDVDERDLDRRHWFRRILQRHPRLHDAEPSGYVAEPTSFLLHVLDATGCVTYSVASGHAAAFIAF
jgi:hypothetical protein